MDRQYAMAVILIIIGIGLTQMGGNDDASFLLGLGIGTVIMAIVWIVKIIIRDIKRRK